MKPYLIAFAVAAVMLLVSYDLVINNSVESFEIFGVIFLFILGVVIVGRKK